MMQHEKPTVQVMMTNATQIPLAADRKVQRIRKKLLIIFGVFLGICIFVLVLSVWGAAAGTTPTPTPIPTPTPTPLTPTNSSLTSMKESITMFDKEKPNYTLQIVQLTTFVLLYGFAYYVTYTYRATGLRVIAWLNIISAILCFLLFIAVVIVVLLASPHMDNVQKDKKFSTAGGIFLTILGVFCLANLLIQKFVAKLCFKLANLIVDKRTIPCQTI
ncbi:hypothetical protein I4U23_011822 [Adineta vaga]|nr:hypothetical protein I4U23_011822 [Adineta vaga]